MAGLLLLSDRVRYRCAVTPPAGLSLPGRRVNLGNWTAVLDESKMGSRPRRLDKFLVFVVVIGTVAALVSFWSNRRQAYFKYVEEYGNPFAGMYLASVVAVWRTAARRTGCLVRVARRAGLVIRWSIAFESFMHMFLRTFTVVRKD